jgi:NADH-quinone oxidoreductase subunit C
MDNEGLKLKLSELFPLASFEPSTDWITLYIEPTDLRSTALQIRHTTELEFDYLFCLTCIDWKTHFTMVYHFSSTIHRHSLVIKAKLDRNLPEIESLSDIWQTAEFHEREVYDLFGVKFLNHPDLRRLFMTDDWKGWPLRKDYEDAVNMIKL